jgi:hypothetical protein
VLSTSSIKVNSKPLSAPHCVILTVLVTEMAVGVIIAKSRWAPAGISYNY